MDRTKAITEKLLTGKSITSHLDSLASLRLDIFEEYPYLYSGRRENEYAYLGEYASKPEACVVLAEEGESLIGAATGMPLRDEDATLWDTVVEGASFPPRLQEPWFGTKIVGTDGAPYPFAEKLSQNHLFND